MKKLFRTMILSLSAVGLASCALKVKILDTAAISMTRGPLERGEHVRETGPVTGEFCMSTFSSEDTQGLLDESVKSAQSKYGVDYIINATFWRKSSCVAVEGTGGKLMAATAAVAQPSVAPKGPPKISPKKSPKPSVKAFKKKRRG